MLGMVLNIPPDHSVKLKYTKKKTVINATERVFS